MSSTTQGIAPVSKIGLPNLTGIIQVTGDNDTGKTSFAIESFVNPSDVCFFDEDVKSGALARQLKSDGIGFGRYINMVQLGRGKTEIDFHESMMAIINNEIKPGQFQTIIFDTWSRFASTFHPYVSEHPHKFRAKYSPMGTIKGAEYWLEARRYEGEILDHLLTLAPRVFIITHLKNHNIAGKRTGKLIPDVSKAVVQKSNLRLWLLQSHKFGGAPYGLVLKRVGKRHYDEKLHKLVTVNVLPDKLSPCTWEKIAEYWENPIGDREPELDERCNDDELAMMDGHLTEWHKWYLRLETDAAKEAEAEEKRLAEVASAEQRAKIFAGLDSGKNPGEISKELDIKIADVMAARKIWAQKKDSK